MLLDEVSYSARGLGPLSIQFQRGEVVWLCGPSGGGKSTLCSLIAGRLEPTKGQVCRGGYKVGTVAADAQGQLVGATVDQEISLGRHGAKASGGRLGEDVGDCLLKRWAGIGSADPQSLSVGSQQLLLLTSLVQGSFSFFVIDEALFGLDLAAFENVCAILRSIARAGGIVLVVSHEMRMRPWADRFLVMSEGKLIIDKPSGEVGEQDFEAARLWRGSVRRFSSFKGAGLGAKDESKELLCYDGRTVVKLQPGQVLAVAGGTESGCSQLLELLVEGEASGSWERWQSKASGYRVFLPSYARSLLWRATVGAELKISLAEGRRRRLNWNEGVTDAAEVPCSWTGRSPKTLSFGQAKFLTLLCLLLQWPSILVCEQPFAGLDKDLRASIEKRLADYLRWGGMMVMTTHSADEVMGYASHLLIVDKGKPSYLGPPSLYFKEAPSNFLGQPYAGTDKAY